LFAIDVHVTVQRPVGDEGMLVIRGANDHGFHVFLIETPTPVPVGFRLRENLEGFLGAEIVDVAQGHDVLVPQYVVVRRSPSPYTDEGDVQLVAGSVLASERTAFQDGQSGGGFQ